MAETKIVPWDRILPAKYFEGLSKDVLKQNLSVKFKRDITFSSGSTTNCGVSLLTNISYHWQPLAKVCTPAGMAVNPPTGWGSAWGTLTQDIENHLDKFVENVLDVETEKDAINAFHKKIDLMTWQCYILTDCCNRASGYRGVASRNGTFEFVQLLKKHKCGYLIESPVSGSHLHALNGDFSLSQVWIYYPEGVLAFKTGKFLGSGKIAKSPEEAAEDYEKYPLMKHRITTGAFTKDWLKTALCSWNKKKVDKAK